MTGFRRERKDQSAESRDGKEKESSLRGLTDLRGVSLHETLQPYLRTLDASNCLLHSTENCARSSLACRTSETAGGRRVAASCRAYQDGVFSRHAWQQEDAPCRRGYTCLTPGEKALRSSEHNAPRLHCESVTRAVTGPCRPPASCSDPRSSVTGGVYGKLVNQVRPSRSDED